MRRKLNIFGHKKRHNILQREIYRGNIKKCQISIMKPVCKYMVKSWDYNELKSVVKIVTTCIIAMTLETNAVSISFIDTVKTL